jgi:hypothetical protein
MGLILNKCKVSSFANETLLFVFLFMKKMYIKGGKSSLVTWLCHYTLKGQCHEFG